MFFRVKTQKILFNFFITQRRHLKKVFKFNPRHRYLKKFMDIEFILYKHYQQAESSFSQDVFHSLFNSKGEKSGKPSKIQSNCPQKARIN